MLFQQFKNNEMRSKKMKQRACCGACQHLTIFQSMQKCHETVFFDRTRNLIKSTRMVLGCWRAAKFCQQLLPRIARVYYKWKCSLLSVVFWPYAKDSKLMEFGRQCGYCQAKIIFPNLRGHFTGSCFVYGEEICVANLNRIPFASSWHKY